MNTILVTEILIFMYLQLIWLLGYKRVFSLQQSTILTLILTVQFLLSIFFGTPYLLSISLLLFIIEAIFIFQFLNSWLLMVLFLYLENAFVILAWLFTSDLSIFLYKLNIISKTTHEQCFSLSPIFQQIILFILIISIKKVDKHYQIFDSISQIQENHTLSSISLLSLLFSLIILRQFAVIKKNNVYFFYLTFIILTLSFTLHFTAYLYSRYYQQQLKKKILAQQYTSNMENISRSDEFRHDSQNILLSLKGFLEKEDTEEALKFISSIKNYSSHLLEKNQYDQVNNLSIPVAQYSLIHFFNQCETKHIQVTLSIPQQIQENDLSIKSIDFIHCLSTLLDFSLWEEAKMISIVLRLQDSFLIFEMANCSVQVFSTFQVSTYLMSKKNRRKQKNLNTVTNILKRYSGTSLTAYSKKPYFMITFSIPMNNK